MGPGFNVRSARCAWRLVGWRAGWLVGRLTVGWLTVGWLTVIAVYDFMRHGDACFVARTAVCEAGRGQSGGRGVAGCGCREAWKGRGGEGVV